MKKLPHPNPCKCQKTNAHHVNSINATCKLLEIRKYSLKGLSSDDSQSVDVSDLVIKHVRDSNVLIFFTAYKIIRTKTYNFVCFSSNL